jgi:hypothetical protein
VNREDRRQAQKKALREPEPEGPVSYATCGVCRGTGCSGCGWDGKVVFLAELWLRELARFEAERAAPTLTIPDGDA